MAATITLQTPDGNVSLGNLRAEFITVTPAAADYATGGYPIVAASIGMTKILTVIPLTQPSGYDPSWNKATGKMQMFGISVATAGATIYAGTELAANTTVAAFDCLVIGL
jgi:hypothetical protein